MAITTLANNCLKCFGKFSKHDLHIFVSQKKWKDISLWRAKALLNTKFRNNTKLKKIILS